ncbi:cytochrome d ubiquinol oxidase subunit II [Mesorhizobium sp. M1C.F.Ca.ET.193.01.1.1]|uniref:cytochrome d ubiquinol oxidase subunit II n=1 Tax=unclassified Mesorhizobium TaxID=325217 RepID=UPI000FD4E640|nr:MULTISPECIES: cytochrome d ubiquinol oxidase subunit II [unclassified Mesorhizobium]TGS93779.1 cytochrome d ubiquinol oxidase subunit II [bacterium M00.F.Ca.ET.177.01.1.1]TGQ50838.1 cytochrome d ubiquinol oxidase subunit II [Mesorhizobium sp. M1C.F.Ca.ET.210.01.1.1]TGQ66281.1 cytochrome d ubiquinol oxidase subunit II [Mesorhizobium sp. M1C.F.Ca.ET.212.01.1.1]TGR00305.1 cytochrome d ubiquinol oxidase subunit II [Mesorhizobium sp. M1C.F.Ca.ET.204.01.1.1]TGR20964.1 cytochrome d ubiquinol oxida
MSFDWPTALPLIFAGLMGLAILIYVILDGFDLGIGILFAAAENAEQDTMIASIGPFWDANETWLVLAVGLLLVAFPMAHGTILSALYLPVFVLLVGLILRGVAFDFRAKVPAGKKQRWNRIFFIGSATASLAQGYMLGVYVLGLDVGLGGMAFGALVALCLSAAYAAMGSAWLIYKTEGDLQEKAVRWLRVTLVLTALGMVAVSLATPFASPRIFDKWFLWPQMLYLSPLPILSALLFLWLWRQTFHLPRPDDSHALTPFLTLAAIFALGFAGLAWSFYPFVVPDRLTIWQAASAPESLAFILVGTVVVLPIIIFYSFYAYRVFGGKATDLRYD